MSASVSNIKIRSVDTLDINFGTLEKMRQRRKYQELSTGAGDKVTKIEAPTSKRFEKCYLTDH